MADLCAATLSVSSIIADVDARADLIFLGILLVIAIFCIFFNRYLPLLEVRFGCLASDLTDAHAVEVVSACWIVLGLIGESLLFPIAHSGSRTYIDS